MILTLTTIICDIAAERKRKAAAKQREVERADSAEWKRKAAMKEREAAGKRSDAAEQERRPLNRGATPRWPMLQLSCDAWMS